MNFLDNLNLIVEQAVGETFADQERDRQKAQDSTISKQKLRAKNDDDEEEVDEDDEAEDEKKEKEGPRAKLTGDPHKVAKKIAKRKKEMQPPGTQSSKAMRSPTSDELKKPDFQLIAKNINLLRGGKSIKDQEVRRNLKAYVDKLSPVERREVLVYLNSLAQVLSGVQTGDSAAQPDHSPLPSTTSRKVAPTKTPATPAAKKQKTDQSGAIIVGAS